MAEELETGDYVTPTVRLVRPLAQGGMGTVWIAEHLTLDTQVVVKLMTKGVELHEGAASRFAREAAIAAAVKSPHVVQVFDSGVTENGTAYIVMELLEGHDLGAHLATHGHLPPVEVARILTQLGKALTKAHRVGVVHRDIKPDNIYLCDLEGEPSFVKLLDFGTAKDDAHAVHSTTLGQLIGTPYYMSPEQILGEPVDHRTDIWSLGVVAYEALTGVRPFDGVTVGAITLAIHATEPRPSTVIPELPELLDAWFAKACARDPAERFQTVKTAVAAFARAAVGDASAPDSSPGSLDDMTAVPSSSVLLPMGSEPLATTTTSLSSTLGSTRARERRTMQWVAGLIGLAAVAAIIALIRNDGGGEKRQALDPDPAPRPAEIASGPLSPTAPSSVPASAYTAPRPTATATSSPETTAPSMTAALPALPSFAPTPRVIAAPPAATSPAPTAVARPAPSTAAPTAPTAASPTPTAASPTPTAASPTPTAAPTTAAPTATATPSALPTTEFPVDAPPASPSPSATPAPSPSAPPNDLRDLSPSPSPTP